VSNHLFLFVAEYWELVESEGQAMCRLCHVPLDWTKRSRIAEHLRSKKHSKAAAEAAATGDQQASGQQKLAKEQR
jgi:hypothetical protein